MQQQAFPKANRLAKQEDFRHSLDNGAKFVDRYFVMKATPSSRPFPRLGIIVTRKFGNAVVRNKFKRRVRECFRRIKHGYSGMDVVIIGRHDAESAETSAFFVALERGLDKLGKRLQR